MESWTQGSRPRTQLPRTEPFEAKGRSARDQGPNAEVFSEKNKKSLLKNLQGLWRAPKRNNIVYDFGQFSTSQKIVHSSSRGQGIFEDLQASRPRPRASNCVLEDVLEAKDVLENSISVAITGGI